MTEWGWERESDFSGDFCFVVTGEKAARRLQVLRPDNERGAEPGVNAWRKVSAEYRGSQLLPHEPFEFLLSEACIAKNTLEYLGMENLP